MAEARQDNRITIKDVRIAYAQGIFEARAGKGDNGQPGKPKFGAAFLFGKDHPATKLISEAVVSAARAKWGAKADEMLKMLKAGDRLPVHSGDAKATSAGYGGNLYLNAGNVLRPLVLNSDRTPLTAADGRPYSGSYVNAIIEIWAQDNQFGKRVNASLLGVQFVRDGERLAGGSTATADDFEAIPGVEGAAEGQASPESLFG